jgi:hypothetical protein
VSYNHEAFNDKIKEILDLDKLGLPLSDEILGEVRAAGAQEMLRQKEDGDDNPQDKGTDIYDGRQHLWLYKTPAKRPTEQNFYHRIQLEWRDER